MMNDKEKVLDVVTMGDLMLDFTEAGVSEDGKLLFERNPGGAPANVAAQVAALGGSSAFMGSVGQRRAGTIPARLCKKNRYLYRWNYTDGRTGDEADICILKQRK